MQNRELLGLSANSLHPAGGWSTARRGWINVGRWRSAVRDTIVWHFVRITDLLVAAKIGAASRSASVAATSGNRSVMASCIAGCADVAYTMDAIVESS